MNLKRKRNLKLKMLVLLAALTTLMVAAEQCENQWEFVSAGDRHSMGLMKNGSVLVWGDNSYGQAGAFDNKTKYNAPTVLKELNEGVKWIQITSSEYSSFGILSDGTLWAWGDNEYGQLGDGTKQRRMKPVQIGSSKNWKMVASGRKHTLALKKDGSLWIWGRGRAGQLGVEAEDDTLLKPTRIETNKTWLKVFAGNSQSFAISDDGTLWAWGENGNGQLGDNTRQNKFRPVQITPQIKWKEIAVGQHHTLGLDVDGHLYAWGGNKYGQLGDGTIEWNTTPSRIGKSIWKSISAGGYSSVGIKEDGSLWEWGYLQRKINSDGGKKHIEPHPVEIGKEFLWKQVSIGIGYTLAVTDEGFMMGWGSNEKLKLGNGDKWEEFVPFPTICSGFGGVCFDGQCVAECPEDYFELSRFCYKIKSESVKCDPSCKSCYGLATYCTDCYEGILFNEARHVCEEKCSAQCKTCSKTKDQCTSCHPGKYLDEKTQKCVQECDSNCQTCHKISSHCTSCPLGYILNSGTKSCDQCHSTCLTCKGSPTTCTSCETPLHLDKENHNCVSYCDENCLTCSEFTNKCTSCDTGYTLSEWDTCIPQPRSDGKSKSSSEGEL